MRQSANRRRRWISFLILGAAVLTALAIWAVASEKEATRLPGFLGFLSRFDRVSLSIEQSPKGYSPNLPSERSLQAVYLIEFEDAVKQARSVQSKGGFREEEFPLPEWIVFWHSDGRFVGLIPGNRAAQDQSRRDRSHTTVVYVRPGTTLERCRDAIGL